MAESLTWSDLVCKLRRKSLARGPSPTAGEIELENASAAVIPIEVCTSPLGYLDLLVTDARGQVVSESFYGDLFSPLAEPSTLELQPGEKYAAPVSLLGNVPQEKCLPGRYSVQAIYQYKGLSAVSEPLEVELPDGQPA